MREDHYDLAAAGDDDTRVLEWELGLPGDDDLTPLSHSLVPANLASAFSISPVTPRTMLEVHRASHTTISSLRRPPSPSSFSPFSSDDTPDPRRPPPPSDDADDDPSSARALKRPRLVWTPQLHKRFVDVVAHLGIKSAVPKTIMQLMNVEGLTRENVASHLQKYRLYLKRMQGLSNEGPSSSDQLFASTPVPQSLHEPSPPVHVPVPYAMPTTIPMPMYGMVAVSNHQGGQGYHGFESHHHHPYGGFAKDWSGRNNFGSIVPHPSRATPNDK